MKHLLLLIFLASPALAHKGSDAYWTLTASGTALSGRLDVALKDLDLLIGLDGNGDGKRIKRFLQALHEGAEGDKALEVLLDLRTFGELEDEIIKAWSRKGVDFTFSD